jgi:hypothetical protein
MGLNMKSDVGSLTLKEGAMIAKNYIETLGDKLITIARGIYGMKQ